MAEIAGMYEQHILMNRSTHVIKGEIWAKHYSSNHQILLVGEGDFSFALSLAISFRSGFNIVASSIDSYDVVIRKYKSAKTNLDLLDSLGARLLHDVDARKMKFHIDLHARKFDRIVYNFPHAGFFGKESEDGVIMMHKNLVCSFFKNASRMLRPNGQVHVSHKTKYPFDSWNIEQLASRSSLTLLECVEFKLGDYPGYNNKRGDGSRSDEPFPLGECCTFKFISSSTAKKSPALYHKNRQELQEMEIPLGRANASLFMNPAPVIDSGECFRIFVVGSGMVLLKNHVSLSQDCLDVSSNERKNDVISFQPPTTSVGKRMSTSIKVMQNHKSPAAPQIKPFSLILPRSTNSKWSGKKQVEIKDSLESSSIKVLGSGMVLLKNHVSLSEQVEIVNKCEELGVGRGGFYQPGFGDGGKLNLQMMCLGRNWDPQTRYDKRYRSDGSEAPPIPDQLIGIAKNALEVSRSLIDNEWEIPLMSPDICIVNFYTTSGQLGLHQDRDESSKSLRKGLPVVSVSIGDSVDFLYGDSRVVKNAANILLESGDVLIFGGKSRHIHHGVKTIIPDSAPEALLKQTMLRPGRLNLTFRQF